MTTSEKLIRNALSQQGYDNDHIDAFLELLNNRDIDLKRYGIVGIFNEIKSRFHVPETLYSLLSDVSGISKNSVKHFILVS